jgi:hypothetical protein
VTPSTLSAVHDAQLAASPPAVPSHAGLLFRGAVTLVLAVFIGQGVAHAVFGISAWTFEDVDAYWSAAERLRAGEQLYAHFDPDSNVVIRYAPWFAFAWVPLTFLPRSAVEVGWGALLVAASVAATLPLLRRPTRASVALAGMLGPFLLWTASRGNVHPLVVAALVLGVQRRSGPLWIALAASLKAVPAIFVLVYIGRREWGRAAATIALTGILTGHMLLFDLSTFAADPGGSQSLLFLSPFVWGTVAAAALAAALFLAVRRSKYTWLGAAVAAMAVLPRFFLYDLTYLLVPAANVDQPSDSRPKRG